MERTCDMTLIRLNDREWPGGYTTEQIKIITVPWCVFIKKGGKTRQAKYDSFSNARCPLLSFTSVFKTAI